MNKTELVTTIASKSGLTKTQADAAVKALVDTVIEELKQGNEVALTGFGSFHVAQRSAREGRNPKTGEIIQIEACNKPVFKAGKILKDAVNNKRAE